MQSEDTSATRDPLELGLFSQAPIYDDFEMLRLTDSLSSLISVYGVNDPKYASMILQR
jgi:hypothetical protein